MHNSCPIKVNGMAKTEIRIFKIFTTEEVNILKKHVINEGQVLKDMKLTNNQLGSAIAGVYDKVTGKIYTAINYTEGKIPGELAPIIKDKIYNMPKEVLNSYEKDIWC